LVPASSRRSHQHRTIRLLGQSAGKIPFFLGLILIVCGTGLLKPNISAVVGDLYPEGGARRDAGFSIFYMGINVGAFLGQLVTGYLGERVDWHVGMGAAGVAMLLGLANYGLRAKKTLGPIGTLPTRHPDPAVQAKQERNVKTFVVSFIAAVVLLFALTATGAIELDAAGIAKYMTYAMVTMAAVFLPSCSSSENCPGGEETSCGNCRVVRVCCDLLVGVRAGTDGAQLVRSRFHATQCRRIRDSRHLVSVGQSSPDHRLRADACRALGGIGKRPRRLVSPAKFSSDFFFRASASC
jgi:hypothetical protein